MDQLSSCPDTTKVTLVLGWLKGKLIVVLIAAPMPQKVSFVTFRPYGIATSTQYERRSLPSLLLRALKLLENN